MSFNPLSVLIIGCGNIAGVFDQDRVGAEFPYTHAGAYSRDARFRLVACVEPDDSRRTLFMATWGISLGFRVVDDIIDSGYRFDVISICSPTANHAHDLDFCLKLKPKLIFCEKPVTTSIMMTERIIKECRNKNILLAVNYSRRYDPDISRLQASMHTGEWGRLRSIVACYNKGILNNGSHLVDLFHLLVGPMDVVSVGRPVQDFFQNDPSIPVWLQGPQGVSVHLSCGHAEDYSLFEIQFIFSQGVLVMEDGGHFWRERRTVHSDIFKDYRVLDEGTRRAGEYRRAMIQAIDNIYRAITNSDQITSTGESALLAQKVCEKAMQMSISNQQVNG